MENCRPTYLYAHSRRQALRCHEIGDYGQEECEGEGCEERLMMPCRRQRACRQLSRDGSRSKRRQRRDGKIVTSDRRYLHLHCSSIARLSMRRCGIFIRLEPNASFSVLRVRNLGLANAILYNRRGFFIDSDAQESYLNARTWLKRVYQTIEVSVVSECNPKVINLKQDDVLCDRPRQLGRALPGQAYNLHRPC